MNDREMLELAAKAIGYRAVFNLADACQLWTDDINSGHIKFWNPLNDDGDAFRLMVQLGLDLDRTAQGWLTVRHTEQGITIPSVRVDTADPRAATRRAIVRAAAELGRRIDASD